MHSSDYHRGFERGKQDFDRDKSPIFRKTQKGIVADIDDPMADEWSKEKREGYIDGYSYE